MMKLNLFYLLVATLVISSQCNPLKIGASTPQIPSLVGLASNDGSQEVGPSSGSHSGINTVSGNSTGEVAVIVDTALDAVFDVMDILSTKVASHDPNDGPQEVGPSSGSHNNSGVNKVSGNSAGEVAVIVDTALDAVFDVMDILSTKVASHDPNDGPQEVGPSSGSHNNSGVNKVSGNSAGEVAVIVDTALDAVFDVMDILSPKVASHVPNNGPQEVGPSSGSHNNSGLNKVSGNSTGEVALIVDTAVDGMLYVMDVLSPKVASHVPNDGPEEVGPSSGSHNNSGVNKVSGNSTGEVALIVDTAVDGMLYVMDVLSPKVASHVPNDGPEEVGPSSGSHNNSGVNKVSGNSTGEVALIVDTAVDGMLYVMDVLSPKVASHVPNDGPEEVGPSSGSHNNSGVNKVSGNSTGEVALIVDTALDGMLYVMDVLSPNSTSPNKSD